MGSLSVQFSIFPLCLLSPETKCCVHDRVLRLPQLSHFFDLRDKVSHLCKITTERTVFYAVSFLNNINTFSQLYKYTFNASGVDVEM